MNGAKPPEQSWAIFIAPVPVGGRPALENLLAQVSKIRIPDALFIPVEQSR